MTYTIYLDLLCRAAGEIDKSKRRGGQSVISLVFIFCVLTVGLAMKASNGQNLGLREIQIVWWCNKEKNVGEGEHKLHRCCRKISDRWRPDCF